MFFVVDAEIAVRGLPIFWNTESSELLCERVVELFHRDLAVAIVVEAAHELVLFVVGHVDVHPAESGSELGEVDDAVIVGVESGEEVDAVLLE